MAASAVPVKCASAKGGAQKRDVSVSDINLEADTCARERLDDEAVKEYACAYAKGEPLPCPLCVRLSDGELILVDGRHRLAAWNQAHPQQNIAIEVLEGSLQDAQWMAASCNAKHGVRRTSADKRVAASLAIKAKPDESDRSIASHIAVDAKTVATVRRELLATAEIPQLQARVGLDGKNRKMPARHHPPCAVIPSAAMRAAQSQATNHDAINPYGKPAAPLAASNAMTPLKPAVAPPCSPPNSQSSSTQLGKSNKERVCDSHQAKSILVPAVFLRDLIKSLPDETLRELLHLLPPDTKDVWALIYATGKNVGVPKETTHEL